jgi:hypothetical protein
MEVVKRLSRPSASFANDTRRVQRDDDDNATIDLPAAWRVWSVFGGMSLACALRGAAIVLGEPDLVPLVAAGSFMRPLEPGPVRLAVRAGRRSKHALPLVAEVGDALVVSATLGDLDELALGRQPDAAFPDPPGPERLRPLRRREPPGLVPCLHRQVDWRALTPWLDGGGGEVLAWLRPRQVPRARDGSLDPLWYAVAADLLGPALVGLTAQFPFMIATATLEVQVLQRTRSPWLLQRVRADLAGEWAAGRLELWDRAGVLVATASQRARIRPAEPQDLPYCVTGFGSGATRLRDV